MGRGIIVFATEWGASASLAETVFCLASEGLEVRRRADGVAEAYFGTEVVMSMCSFSSLTYWYYTPIEESGAVRIMLIIGTAAEGLFPKSCVPAWNELSDLAHDHREDYTKKDHVSYCVVGLGDIAYGGDVFCRPALELNK